MNATGDGRAGSPLPAERTTTNDGAHGVTRPTTASLPHNYVTEPHHRIEIYRKLAQATDKPALDALQKELRDRFGPLPPPVELLLAVGELKILASDKAVTAIEVEEDKLMTHAPRRFYHARRKIPAPDEKGRQGAA